MANRDLGAKQKCQNCGTKFFDLNKDPVVCPKCGTVQSGGAPTSPRAAAARQPAAVEDDESDAETPEVVSLDDADQIDDGKVAAATPEDDIDVDGDDAGASDDDTFLEEEEDDGGNVSDLIDGDIEDDEER